MLILRYIRLEVIGNIKFTQSFTAYLQNIYKIYTNRLQIALMLFKSLCMFLSPSIFLFLFFSFVLIYIYIFGLTD